MFGSKKQKSPLELEAEELEAELRETDDPEERAQILEELDDVYSLIERKNPPKQHVSPDTWVKGGIVVALSFFGWWVDKNGGILPKSFRSDSTERLFKL